MKKISIYKNKNCIKVLVLFLLTLISLLILFFVTQKGWKKDKSQNLIHNNSEKILEENLKKHVMYLSEEIGIRDSNNYDNLLLAADYIKGKFNEYGYKTESQKYFVEDKEYENIIAFKNEDLKKETIIVGAHYDSDSNPGADDNASGIAGILELSKILSEKDAAYDVKFVVFTNEEMPFFKTEQMGSKVFVNNLKKEEKK